MNKLVAGVAVLLVIGGASGSGARAASSRYNWAGCYAGINGGYGWNSGRSAYANDPNAPNPDIINGLPDPLGLNTYTFISVPAHARGSGGLAGGGVGCNFQNRPWVWGFEADIDWAHVSGSGTNIVNSGPLSFEIGPGGGSTSILNTVTANEQVSLRWLSTIRARLGFAIQDRLLLYTTGGVAIGGADTQGSITTFSPFPLFINPGWTGSSSAIKGGGVIGAGAEWAFSDRWSAKAEYLWYDLGRVSHPLNCILPGGATCGVGLYPTLGNTASSVYGSILRIGINYKLGL